MWTLKYSQRRFDLTQTEVNTIGTAANLGTNFSFLFSLVNDFLGARACSLVSGIFLFGSYFAMSLTVSGAIPWAENYIALSVFMFLMGNASGGGYTASITTSIKNFPERNRGLVGKLTLVFNFCDCLSWSACFMFWYQQCFLLCILLVHFSTRITTLHDILCYIWSCCCHAYGTLIFG